MAKIDVQNFGSTNYAYAKSNTGDSFQDQLIDMMNSTNAQTFSFNSSEAAKERAWSEYMSDTSHQREVDDLKRAGLNPVLSANGGAQAYSGASASGKADSSALGALASIYQTKMNNENAIQIAKMNNEVSLKMAKINAAASNYAANLSSSAQRYASDNSAGASYYATQHTKQGAINEFINGLTGSENGSKLFGEKVRSIFSSSSSARTNKANPYKKK